MRPGGRAGRKSRTGRAIHELQSDTPCVAPGQRHACRGGISACLRARQTGLAFFRGVFRQGHPGGHDQDVRRGDQGRFHARALLRRHAIQAGDRTRRPAARQSRGRQHRAAGYLQPDPRLVGPHIGLSVPGCRSSPDLLQQRARRRVQEDGRRSTRRAHPGPHLFRRPPGRSEAGQGDQHAGGHGRHQAAHARRRCLAVPGDGARRQSDADGLCRGLYRAADRAPSTARTIRCPTCRT